MITELTEAKKIIEQRFECLKKAFKEKFGEDLTKSPLQKCFYYPEHLEEILKWNHNAESIDDLIDLAGYNEHTIGNIEKAKLVFLGNNPGSAGVFGDNQEEEMQKIRKSIQYLSDSLWEQFYPIANAEMLEFKPWFPRKLAKTDSLLGPFLKNNSDICRFAPYIASAELSPYHTRYFSNANLQTLSTKKNDEIHGKIRACMKRDVLLIALFVGAKDRWIEQIPELAEYRNFYFCHNAPRCLPRFSKELEKASSPGKSAYEEVICKLTESFRTLHLI